MLLAIKLLISALALAASSDAEPGFLEGAMSGALRRDVEGGFLLICSRSLAVAALTRRANSASLSLCSMDEDGRKDPEGLRASIICLAKTSAKSTVPTINTYFMRLHFLGLSPSSVIRLQSM